jgi:hypothetical protein
MNLIIDGNIVHLMAQWVEMAILAKFYIGLFTFPQRGTVAGQ